MKRINHFTSNIIAYMMQFGLVETNSIFKNDIWTLIYHYIHFERNKNRREKGDRDMGC